MSFYKNSAKKKHGKNLKQDLQKERPSIQENIELLYIFFKCENYNHI